MINEIATIIFSYLTPFLLRRFMFPSFALLTIWRKVSSPYNLKSWKAMVNRRWRIQFEGLHVRHVSQRDTMMTAIKYAVQWKGNGQVNGYQGTVRATRHVTSLRVMSYPYTNSLPNGHISPTSFNGHITPSLCTVRSESDGTGSKRFSPLCRACCHHLIPFFSSDAVHSEVGFLAFASSPASMTNLFNVSTANMGFINISQDLFCHKFQGVCFYFSSLLHKLKTTAHFLMTLLIKLLVDREKEEREGKKKVHAALE
ncbi:hypothetical protein VNO77_24837 [Canavalia gladiata]|uniref:Uncharacterized protein n=1 Tax=Canavalia gladiata TaxID=3824 RepID=A0AAN9LAG1_CANGL